MLAGLKQCWNDQNTDRTTFCRTCCQRIVFLWLCSYYCIKLLPDSETCISTLTSIFPCAVARACAVDCTQMWFYCLCTSHFTCSKNAVFWVNSAPNLMKQACKDMYTSRAWTVCIVSVWRRRVGLAKSLWMCCTFCTKSCRNETKRVKVF